MPNGGNNVDTLIYFALWAGLVFLMMQLGCGAHAMGRYGRGRRDGSLQDADELRWVPPETDVDPVCGRTIHTDKGKPSVHDGMVYYFCSRECRERFEAAPPLYVGSPPDARPQQMHPAHGARHAGAGNG